MRASFLDPRRALLGGAAFALLLAAGACATDNGDPLFGQAFGPPGADGGTQADGAPLTDAPPPPPGDGAPSGDGGGGGDAAACTARVAVVCGDATSLTGSVWAKDTGWVGQALAGGAAASVPAIAPFGTGFLALTRGPAAANGPLQSVLLESTWRPVEGVGAATTRGAPALAVAGADAHAVYQGTAFTMFHAKRVGAAWSGVDAPIGAPQSFGPTPPAAAAVGADVVMAFAGDAGGGAAPVYTHVLSGVTWGASSAIAGSVSFPGASPALAAVPAAAVDVVLVYVDDATRRLMSSARATVGKAWSAPTAVHALATSNEGASVVALSSSALVLVFRGQDDRPYFSRGTIAGAAVTWTPAAALVSDASVKVTSHPSVAPGVCGDDAIAVLASPGGAKAIRLRGASWTAPESVTGALGGNAAIATR